MAKSQSYDVVLDVYAPHNRNVRFWPAGETLRGEVRMTELATDRPPGALLSVGGSIPGQRLLIDTAERHVKIVDRMNLPENADKDRALRKLTQTEQYYRFAYKEYEPDIDYGVPVAEWPTWLWHLKRLVDHGRLKVVKGSLPGYSEIAAMCDHAKGIRIQLGDSCNVRPEDLDRPFYAMDERDAEKLLELETAGA